jgi:hypothetical protein
MHMTTDTQDKKQIKCFLTRSDANVDIHPTCVWVKVQSVNCASESYEGMSSVAAITQRGAPWAQFTGQETEWDVLLHNIARLAEKLYNNKCRLSHFEPTQPQSETVPFLEFDGLQMQHTLKLYKYFTFFQTFSKLSQIWLTYLNRRESRVTIHLWWRRTNSPTQNQRISG